MSEATAPPIPALSWYRLTRADPLGYRRLAERNLSASAPGSTERALLLGVIARAHCDFNEVGEAETFARRALRELPKDGAGEARAELAALLGNVLTLRGRIDEATDVLTAAEEVAGVVETGIIDVQRAAIDYRRGQMERAFDASERAIARIGSGHPVERARALNNRGVIRLYLGNLDDGQADFEEAEQLYRRVGMRIAAAQVLHNSGMLAARFGDLSGALDRFARAETELIELGYPIDAQIVVRAEVMVSAGLYHEVVELLPDVITRLDTMGNHADAAEGELYVAQSMLETGDPHTGEFASRASKRFEQGGRPGWAALLADLAIEADAAANGDGHLDLGAAMRAALALDRSGMQVFATASWLRAGRAALAQQRADLALPILHAVSGRRGTAIEKIFGYEAAARLALHGGDRRRAGRLVTRGLDVVESLRSILESTDLRVHTSRWGDGLAELAIEIAWSSRRAGSILRASERWRSTALPTVRMRHASANASTLGSLRTAQASVRAAAMEGRSPDDAAAQFREAQQVVAMEARRRRLEQPVRPLRLDLPTLRSALGRTALVSLVEHAGALGAVVTTNARQQFVVLGPSAPIRRSAAAARQALDRLARLGASPAAPLVMTTALAHLAVVRERIVAPLLPRLRGAGDLVLVPGPNLFALPWNWLVGKGFAVSVSPSAVRWLERGSADSAVGPVRAIAGPGLPGAEQEARRVAEVHSGASCVVGRTATIRALADVLDGAALAHVAAHATIHPVNPLFSSLEMADGPATGYDLERIQRAPRIAVLSACSSAHGTQRSMGEMLGLATVFLRAGTTSLVASTVALPDDEGAALLVGFHERLAAGVEIARCVMDASAAIDDSTPGGLVAACALACYGRGDTRLQSSAVEHEPGGDHRDSTVQLANEQANGSRC